MRDSAAIWVLIGSCSLLFILCDGLSAHWAKTGHLGGIGAVTLLAPVTYLVFALIVQRSNLAIGATTVNMLTVVGGVVVGVLLFKEQVSTPQYLGIGLAVVSLGLMNVSN